MRNYNVKHDSDATVVLSISELISILKAISKNEYNIDFDELDINVIAKYSNNRLHMTLDTELLRNRSMCDYIQFVKDMKKFFGPYIFTVNTAIDTNILINKLFSGYELYRITEDMMIEIYY